MNRKLGVVLLALIGVAVAVWFAVGRGGGKRATPKPGPGTATAVTPTPRGAGGAEAPAGPRPVLARDSDPAGPMLLEGVVLDERDQPVAGADVWVSSAPPRRMQTEADGTFTFDKLLGRTYAVGARAGDRVGGPVSTRAAADAEPVVIRLRPGAVVRVTVTDAATTKPVAGATVTLADALESSAVTDGTGVAAIHGVGDGWIALTVAAPGFAPGAGNAVIGKTQREVEVAITVRAGAAVSGVVVDDRGQPVAAAKVWAKDASSWEGPGDRAAVTSDALGAFTIPAVAPGSYRLVASDEKHAPGQSELVTVDRDRGATGVKIVLAAAARITGTVYTADSQPAPYATVRVSSTDWSNDFVYRQAAADDRGEFVIDALPRRPLRLRGESELATSKIVDVDLTNTPEKTGVKLVLDQAGAIAGIVVDSAGEPVAEASVTAVPDFMSGETATADLVLASSSAATTDGGGRFTLRGLAEGSYRLAASREGHAERTAWGKDATTARTGATDVKLVLPTPGGVRGKLVLAKGGAPELALVRAGWEYRATTRDGTFELGAMAPGKYDLKISGPDFAEVTKGDLEIVAGQIKDLGTITVSGGRTITGRVVDGKGAPVAGARVMVGRMLFGDGKAMGGDDDAQASQVGMRTAKTADDGTFTLRGVSPSGGSILAEHATRGRSLAIPVTRGMADVADVELTLRGFGSLAGTITRKGAPVPNATITATSMGSTAQAVFVQAGPDGRFVIDRVPEGPTRIQAAVQVMMSSINASRVVTVVLGKPTDASIEIPAGEIKLTIGVEPEPGATVNAAFVMLMRGTFTATTGSQLLDAAIGAVPADNEGSAAQSFWLPPLAIPVWSDLMAGTYSLCAVPITGNVIGDTTIAERALDNMDRLIARCKPALLTPTPAEQKITIRLPSQPLPTPGEGPDAGVP
ncbi:MAG: carboxypeptidase regulatory-like domain-containing protein [Myxococcales bacterium]|nr:carboxypeptidase regulatory-like domain-containing protein [Myxococcales bacterium]